MYEKILQKLKEQRESHSNVSDRSLEDLAKSLVSVITTDEQLTVTNLAPAIKSIDGNINSYTAKQVEAAKLKAIEDAKKTGEPTVQPDIAKLISDALSPIVSELNGLKATTVNKSRGQILSEKLKETPLLFRTTVLKSFERQSFKDDEDFNGYLTDIETQAKAAVQEGKERGLNFGAPDVNVHKPDPDQISPEMEKTIKAMTEQKTVVKPF